jgi:hypothetical protein
MCQEHHLSKRDANTDHGGLLNLLNRTNLYKELEMELLLKSYANLTMFSMSDVHLLYRSKPMGLRI